MSVSTPTAFAGIDTKEYRRRISAWTMYDWANSAFVTTVMAALLPIYYSDVAGATLPSKAAATALWSIGLSVSLFITAIMSPILGTISDVIRGKKVFLSVFAGVGILATGLLALVTTGDWMLASFLFIIGRIGFTSANVFYDALLPHVAKEEDRDRVSTRGYAMGYLGGGILLAINVLMVMQIPGNWGVRLSFISVALWWGIFSVPLLRRVPEPPAAPVKLGPGENVVGISLRRLGKTFSDIRQFRQLFKFLLAFLIYNDGIGTIIGVSAIYGSELGFGIIELTLALLLVQFVGIPFSLIFGRIPSKEEPRRAQFLAFVAFNMIALPLVGIIGFRTLPADLTGGLPPTYETDEFGVGQGTYGIQDAAIARAGSWSIVTIPAEAISGGRFLEAINNIFGAPSQDTGYAISEDAGDAVELSFNGQRAQLTYGTGPDHGLAQVLLDDRPYLEGEEPLIIDMYSPDIRFGSLSPVIQAEAPGTHRVSIIVLGERNPASTGNVIKLSNIEVFEPIRQQNLLGILGLILVIQAIGAVFALLLGRPLFSGIAERMDTKRTILLALLVYAIIAIWAFFLNSTIEFWFLAWMVAIVQGGSQALSRSLYASMSPASKSGEFFGLFGVMEKFSAILGPILFATAGALFASSRPAILSIILFFILGGLILSQVDVDEGRLVAKREDQEAFGTD
jgi:UMF1 family MFS transporter